MKAQKAIDFESLKDFQWVDNGQSVLKGSLLNLYHQLDTLFVRWAETLGAKAFLFPTFIPASQLHKLHYFQHFPHLVTFPVTLSPEVDNLEQFIQANNCAPENKPVQLTRLSPVEEVLTPAACYHFYIHLQGQNLSTPTFLTTCCTCFRREEEYLPLQRQWSFSMREIVCIGTADEVKVFLDGFEAKLVAFFKAIQLPIQWENATDPFFKPDKNPKYLLQKLDPVKTEIVFQDQLAIGSLNFHRNYFGEAFQIWRGESEAFSACVAFGLERWIYAFLTHFGPDENDWPCLDEASV
jgi:seryl-tRNA synthetase